MPRLCYPYYNELQRLTKDFAKGNFGLWFNKFIPIRDFQKCKPCDLKGNENEPVSLYFDQYRKMDKKTIRDLLKKRHIEQAAFCRALSCRYEIVTIKAKLSSPLITGIGEPHPHEIGMLFDHNLGIPYIPASTIKGITRFAHILERLPFLEDRVQVDKDGLEYFDDENDQMISSLFGNQEKRGSVIFMDAYPENIPDLHVDIMNPHYGEYYSDDKNKIPPADYLNPTPIKFLTVQKGTVFIFRSLVRNDVAGLADEVKKAYVRALTEEGIGAKTSLGYGLFRDLSYEEAACVTEFEKEERIRKQKEEMETHAKAEQERLASMTEDEKMLERINKLGKEGSEISALVNECLSGDFDRSVYRALKEKLNDFGEWKPYGSKQKKAKMRKRKAEIEAKIEGK